MTPKIMLVKQTACQLIKMQPETIYDNRPDVRWRQKIAEPRDMESHGIQFDVLSSSPLMMMSYDLSSLEE